jgi:hypothetical protein
VHNFRELREILNYDGNLYAIIEAFMQILTQIMHLLQGNFYKRKHAEIRKNRTVNLYYCVLEIKRLPKLLFRQPFSYVRNYFTANTIGITN